MLLAPLLMLQTMQLPRSMRQKPDQVLLWPFFTLFFLPYWWSSKRRGPFVRKISFVLLAMTQNLQYGLETVQDHCHGLCPVLQVCTCQVIIFKTIRDASGVTSEPFFSFYSVQFLENFQDVVVSLSRCWPTHLVRSAWLALLGFAIGVKTENGNHLYCNNK